MEREGKLEIDLNTRMGDPICDYFAVQRFVWIALTVINTLRFATKTLFALADGCNWGPKPRAAAVLAVNTYAILHAVSNMALA